METTKMTESQLAEIKVNRERFWRELHETCEWGKGARWGEYVIEISYFKFGILGFEGAFFFHFTS